MIKGLLIIALIIAMFAVVAFVVFICILNENSKKIEKELREDGYYD